MHLLRPALAAALLAATVLTAPAAQATNISVQVLTQVTDNVAFTFGPFVGAFTLGEDVRITYTFDDAAVDLSPAAGSGNFQSALSQLDVEFLTSGLSFLFGNPFSSIGTSDDVPLGNDSVSFNSASRLGGSLLGGAAPSSIAVGLGQFHALDPIPVAGDLVVNDRPTASPFTVTEVVFTVFDSSGVQTQLLLEGGTATAVPEPGIALLFGASLFAGAVGVRRR